MSSFLENYTKLEELIKNLETDLKTIKNLSKEIKKTYTLENKGKKSKTKKSDNKEVRKAYGITEKVILPPNVNEFVKYTLDNKKISEEFIKNNSDIFDSFDKDTLVARTKVNSIIHNYIKTNNLYINEEKRTEFKPDDKLKVLFDMKENEELNLRNIQTYLKRAYDKFKTTDKKKESKKSKESKEDSKDETENDSEEEETEETE
jgi:hypothetical protein